MTRTFRSMNKTIATIFLILCSCSAFAGTDELESKIMQTIDWDQVMVPINNRRATALAIQTYWQDFENRVPNLSPAEERWVEEELGGSSERVNRAFNSREFALWSLDQTIEGCLAAISSVLSSQQVNPEAEMFYWLKVLHCYHQTEDALIYLQRAGLSNGRRDGAFSMRTIGIVESRIVNFIAPSAMAETMGWSLNQTEGQD